MSDSWYLLCDTDAVMIGEARGFDPLAAGRDTLFVIRQDDDSFVAYHNACPHIPGARMAWKKDKFLSSDGQYITCFAHGAVFRKEDGKCILGPCLGQRLVSVPVDIKERRVYVWLGEGVVVQ